MPVIAIAALTITIAGVAVATLAWRKPKSRHSSNVDPQNLPTLYQIQQKAPVHSANGTPSLQQLTDGIKLDAKGRGLAEYLYELGLKQYDHVVNNRDGVISEARRAMASLRPVLDPAERDLAKQAGVALAAASNRSQRIDADAKYRELSPIAKTYAQHTRLQYEAQDRIARDLEKSVPRTDYTPVKERISSGSADLNAIVTELPIPWQSIRTLNDEVERPPTNDKPPKPEYVHVEFRMSDGRILQDKRAEKDGAWLTSYRHGFLVPCPHQVVPTGKAVLVVNRDPTTEWETEFWRQGGHMDQSYLRAVAGTLPRQLREAYRRRQIRKAQWGLIGILVIINIMLFAVNRL